MIARGEHIISEFDQQLKLLRENLLSMGRLARSQVEDAVRGLIERRLELCNGAIAEDDAVDEYEIVIDKLGMGILLKYQPVATDLRTVLASLSISRNLERVSDHAVEIAKRAKKLLKKNELSQSFALEPLFQIADGLLFDGLKAFTDDDIELASQLKDRNIAFHREVKGVVKKLTQSIEDHGEEASGILHLIFICRSLERVGDLSVNVAEDTVFNETATNPKHTA